MGFLEKLREGFKIGVEAKSKHPISIGKSSRYVFKKSNKWEKKEEKRMRKEAKRK
ncbi:MAG: hypothetical protein ACLTFJ_09985 [Clostridium sp.]